MPKAPPGSPRPAAKPQRLADEQSRRAREAAALRANLRKRKAQARARTAKPEDAGQA